MGTESEALRWKQWIDRWIKISAPETAQSIASSTSSSKIDPNASGVGQRKSLLSTEQLRYQLINMVKVIIWFEMYALIYYLYLFRKVTRYFVKVFVKKF